MPLAPINEDSPLNRNHPLAQGLEVWWAYGSRTAPSTVRNAAGPKYEGIFTLNTGGIPTWAVATNSAVSFSNLGIAPYYLTNSGFGWIASVGVPACLNYGSTAFTLSGWWRRHVTAPRFSFLATQPASPTTFNCQPVNGGSAWTVYFSASNTTYNNYAIPGASSDRSWKFATFVYDGTQSTNQTRMRVYHNGTELTSNATAGTIPASLPSTDTTLRQFSAVRYDSSSNVGAADLKVHSYAMNEQQVLALYRESLSGNANLLNRVPLRMWVPSAAPSGNRIRRVICGGLV